MASASQQIYLNSNLPGVPLYPLAEFDKLPLGKQQTVLRIVVRPVCEHEQMTTIKQGVELALGQTLWHMGLLDVKNNRVYHYNDPIGGNAPSKESKDSKGAKSASAKSAAAPPESGATDASAFHTPSFAERFLPQLQHDKLKARWVSASVTDFMGPHHPKSPPLCVAIPLTAVQQTRGLEHAQQMCKTYLTITDDEAPAYDAFKFNCQHMVFKMLGAPIESYSGQADLVLNTMSRTANAGVGWVQENPKTALAGAVGVVGLGVVFGMLYSWATGDDSASSQAPAPSAKDSKEANPSKASSSPKK